VSYRGCSDKKVEVADGPAQPSQTPSLAAENSRHLFVDSQHADASNEVAQNSFIFGWIS
jgi:hypothetical protein